MLRSKAFVKVTKRGNVVQVVKEHYLRDDIGCGINPCPKCVRTSDSGPWLSNGQTANSNYTQEHYLIPDTNVIIQQVHPIVPPICSSEFNCADLIDRVIRARCH